MILLAAGGLAPTGQGMAQVIRAGPRTCEAAALTFDLCPVRGAGGYDAPLIALLTERRIPATFFLSGRWMAAHEAEVRALLAVPFFEVGAHGQAHLHLPLLGGEELRSELQGPITLLEQRHGYRTRLFRPPYGEYDDAATEMARALGLRVILWSVVSGDPDPRLTAAAILGHLQAMLRKGSIVVFHANGKGWHTRAVIQELTERVLPQKGLRPVTVTDLLERCPTGAGR
jgi:peptidoglycan/xylan/chitin deacetylase (PgdA/CDA1 family)